MAREESESEFYTIPAEACGPSRVSGSTGTNAGTTIGNDADGPVIRNRAGGYSFPAPSLARFIGCAVLGALVFLGTTACEFLRVVTGEEVCLVRPECVEGVNGGEPYFLYFEAYTGSTGSTDNPQPMHGSMRPGAASDFYNAEVTKLEPLEPLENGRFAYEVRMKNGQVLSGTVPTCHF